MTCHHNHHYRIVLTCLLHTRRPRNLPSNCLLTRLKDAAVFLQRFLLSALPLAQLLD